MAGEQQLEFDLPQAVNFQNIAGTVGKVVIEGYLKSEFVNVSRRNITMSCGTGAITDGLYKINIQVARLERPNIPKGAKIEVIGFVRSIESPIIIYCSDMSQIKELNNQPRMPLNQLIRGVRAPRRSELVEPDNARRPHLDVPAPNNNEAQILGDNDEVD